MASVASALQRIKDDLNPFLPEAAILTACRKAGHHWRRRQLGPAQTIPLFILQVLNFNTAMTGPRHLAKTAVNAPAYCKARMRLPLADPVVYPKEKIAELYDVRWQVETHFAELKTTLKMRKVKSKTSQGVLKELTVYALVYNLIHLVMPRAAQRQGVQPDRISFIDTVRWLISARPGEPLPDLLINPHRPDRHEPRVVKDREDTYTKMTRPRQELRKALKTRKKAA